MVPFSLSILQSELVPLYNEMADLTLPKCEQCRMPLSCCSPEYCEMTIECAQNRWGVELKRTNHPKLPLMGEKGCIADPHFRVLCTLHVCSINSIGCDIKDLPWTEKYFELRGQINEVEYRIEALPRPVAAVLKTAEESPDIIA